MQQRPAFLWFDFLRFAAALLVVLEHARDLLWVNAAAAPQAGMVFKAIYFLTGFGHEAVMVFFVLSGFWISAAIDRRQDSPDFWHGYLIDRMSRLLVVLVPALLIGGAMDAAGAFGLGGPLYFGNTGAASLQESAAAHLSGATFLGNLAFLQSLAVPAFGSNGPLWSLAYEFWYYLWYPALLLAFKRQRLNIALLSLAVGIAWPELIPGFAVWLMGSAIYHADSRNIGQRLFTKGRALSLFVCAVAVWAAAMALSRMAMLPSATADLAVGFSFALAVWSVLKWEPEMPSLVKPLARYGAEASFSLYASHFPLLVLASTIALGGAMLAPGAGSTALLLCAVGLALIFGQLFARLTEARTKRVRGWLRTRLPAAPRASS